MVVLSTFKLSIETFYDSNEEKSKFYFKEIINYGGLIINIYFTLIIIIKSVSYGFIFDKNSYLRNFLNVCTLLSATGYWIPRILQYQNLEFVKV